jgi:small basic protein (TIGR04137 family)
MSIHKSLKVVSGLSRARNVLTRVERLEALSKAGKYTEGDSVYGLAKVRTQFKSKKVPKKAKATDEAKPAEGDAAAEDAAVAS